MYSKVTTERMTLRIAVSKKPMSVLIESPPIAGPITNPIPNTSHKGPLY
jgi:hypothetical protein